MKLQYGQKLKSKDGMVFSIQKYWEDDTDPMAYKVKLFVLEDGETLLHENYYDSFYSSDLVSLVKDGVFAIDSQEIWDKMVRRAQLAAKNELNESELSDLNELNQFLDSLDESLIPETNPSGI